MKFSRPGSHLPVIGKPVRAVSEPSAQPAIDYLKRMQRTMNGCFCMSHYTNITLIMH